MTSVSGGTAIADPPSSRSSVASKRFPLPHGRLARFRFARIILRNATDGTGWSRTNLRSRPTASARARMNDADDQPADRKSAHGAEVAQEGAGAAAVAAEARRLHARLHDDAEEAELGAAQGRQGASDQRLRSDRLHPG